MVSAVAEGCRSVQHLRPDRHRLQHHPPAGLGAGAGYLRFEPRKGYRLGSRLVELGFMAYRDSAITTTARPLLERAGRERRNTVHLAARMKASSISTRSAASGHRVNTRIGGRKPVCSTSVGKALILDPGARSRGNSVTNRKPPRAWADACRWMNGWPRWRSMRPRGYTFDLAENVDGIRCVGTRARCQQRHRHIDQRDQHGRLYRRGAHARDHSPGAKRGPQDQHAVGRGRRSRHRAMRRRRAGRFSRKSKTPQPSGKHPMPGVFSTGEARLMPRPRAGRAAARLPACWLAAVALVERGLAVETAFALRTVAEAGAVVKLGRSPPRNHLHAGRAR